MKSGLHPRTCLVEGVLSLDSQLNWVSDGMVTEAFKFLPPNIKETSPSLEIETLFTPGTPGLDPDRIKSTDERHAAWDAQ